jgi:hypothetical protein
MSNSIREILVKMSDDVAEDFVEMIDNPEKYPDDKYLEEAERSIKDYFLGLVGEDEIAEKVTEQGYVWRSTKNHYRNQLRKELRTQLNKGEQE